ncbi:HAD domain-containing protein [uncultured Oxalicibacterium sp.]|uniref:HAD domain-containing protein n=1 Tax=uncultured Oxalicibacterium sp. TaxID=1168540 RepID=UPI0025D265CF|nr:HAD domain-containing protein [uncultured Oxalicibacterium sp.]
MEAYFGRLIFLDFDGCLHPDSVYMHPKKGIYLREPGHHLFEWEPILVELLCDHPNVGIVLSTSWVSRKSYSYAKSQLSPELQKRIIGATFHNRHTDKEHFAQISRASQIFSDISRRGIKEDDWIAIDDDAEGWPFMYSRNLIRTNGATGISDPAVQEEIKTWLAKWGKS